MAGRPRIYNDVEELEKAIEEYFNIPITKSIETFAGTETIPTGETERIKKPTVTGLALHLGFADKTTLYEYRDREEFSYPIKKALTRIEQYHEEGLSESNVAGRIFALKNMGWKDKQDVELTGSEGSNLFGSVDYSKLSSETLEALLAAKK